MESESFPFIAYRERESSFLQSDSCHKSHEITCILNDDGNWPIKPERSACNPPLVSKVV